MSELNWISGAGDVTILDAEFPSTHPFVGRCIKPALN